MPSHRSYAPSLCLATHTCMLVMVDTQMRVYFGRFGDQKRKEKKRDVIGGSYATQGGGQIELPVKRRSYSSVERGLSACSTAFLAIYRSEYERSVYTASSGCTSVLIQLGAARDKTPHPIKSVINIHGNGSILLPFKKLSHPLSLK